MRTNWNPQEKLELVSKSYLLQPWRYEYLAARTGTLYLGATHKPEAKGKHLAGSEIAVGLSACACP